MTAPSFETKTYLWRLDRAARWLPRAQADELHEQIASHFAEAILEGNDRAATLAVIADLGNPSALVRDVTGPRRRLRTRLTRVRWFTWTIAAGLAAAAVLAAVIVVPQKIAADLVCPCGQGIVGKVDRHTVRFLYTPLGDATQITARNNARQGIVLALYNPSSVSQTILGFAHGHELWGPIAHYQIRIGTTEERAPLQNHTFRSVPMTIPPHQLRDVQIIWTHLQCPQGLNAGTPSVDLRVKVGLFTRNETIDLIDTLILKSTVGQRAPHPKSGKC